MGSDIQSYAAGSGAPYPTSKLLRVTSELLNKYFPIFIL